MLTPVIFVKETSQGWIAMRKANNDAMVKVGGPYTKTTMSNYVTKLKNHGVIPSGWGTAGEKLEVRRLASDETVSKKQTDQNTNYEPIPEISPYERFGLIEPAISNIYGQYKNPRAFCALICGSAGIGKTTEVERVLSTICEKITVDIEMINDSEATPYHGQGYIVLNGSLSSAQLYAVLEQYPSCCIVIDDVDDAMKKSDIINVLMSATATNDFGPRRISKNKKGGKSFDFSGSIVLISNLPAEKNHPAMLSRSNTNTVEIILSPSEMKSFVMDRIIDGIVSVSTDAMNFTLGLIDTYGDHPELRPIDVRVACQVAEEAEKEIRKATDLGTDQSVALARMKTRILYSQKINRNKF